MTKYQFLSATAVAAILASAASAAPFRVMDFGAKADGAADDTAAFQKSLDEAGKTGGGVVEVPAGRYTIKGNLKVPAGVTLQGTFRVPPTIQRNAAHELGGSVLLAFAGRGQEQGEPFIRLAGNNAAIAGLVVTYPEWKQSDVPPVPYPPCVFSVSVVLPARLLRFVIPCCTLACQFQIWL